MARGRKRIEEPRSELISIRITKKEKELIKKNKWIKKEIDQIARNHLKIYSY